MKSLSVTIQVKATEQYFLVVLVIMLYKVALTFESVNKILKCDPSKQLLSSTFLCPVLSCLSVMLYKVVLTFGFVD